MAEGVGRAVRVRGMGSRAVKSTTLTTLPSPSCPGSGAPATRAPMASPSICWTDCSSSPPPPTARKTQSRSSASGAGGAGVHPLWPMGTPRSEGEVAGPARSPAGLGIEAVASEEVVRVGERGGGVGDTAGGGGGGGGAQEWEGPEAHPRFRLSRCLSGPWHSASCASESETPRGPRRCSSAPWGRALRTESAPWLTAAPAIGARRRMWR